MAALRGKFGKRLRYLRRNHDLTQEEFAERVGVSVDFISNVERGVNAPSFETIEKFAFVLKISVHELFLYNEDNSNE